MSGHRSKMLRRLAAAAEAAGFTDDVKRIHRDDGVSRYRGVRHRVYQELKRTWSSSRHHVVGTFTGARDRSLSTGGSPTGGREHWEKVRTDYLRRMG